MLTDSQNENRVLLKYEVRLKYKWIFHFTVKNTVENNLLNTSSTQNCEDETNTAFPFLSHLTKVSAPGFFKPEMPIIFILNYSLR